MRRRCGWAHTHLKVDPFDTTRHSRLRVCCACVCHAQAVLEKAAAGEAEVLLGTHNQGSVEMAVRRMAELGVNPADRRVSFGQLLGMSDHLTFTLGECLGCLGQVDR